MRRSYDQSDRSTSYAWAEIDNFDAYPDDFGGEDEEPDAEWVHT